MNADKNVCSLNIFSLNVRSYSEEKFKKIIEISNPDIILLQETRAKSISPIPGYFFHYSYLAYAGVLTAVREKHMDKIKNILVLQEGRLVMIELLNGEKLFNVYHKRVSNKNDLGPRIEYDKKFLECLEKFKGDRLTFCGDFNSVHKFHDCAKNLSIPDDLSRVCPDNWSPGFALDKKFGCYERHFISSFIKNFKLIDNGIGKGFTFKKCGNDCMRIDFLLTSLANNSYRVVDMNDLSDHKALTFII